MQVTMKLSEIRINNHVSKAIGLKEFQIKDLGSIFLVVGENGSGKSRLLNAIKCAIMHVESISYEKYLKIKHNKDSLAAVTDVEGIVAAAFAHDSEQWSKLIDVISFLKFDFDEELHANDLIKKCLSTINIVDNEIHTNTYLNIFNSLSIGVPDITSNSSLLLASYPLGYIKDAFKKSYLEKHYTNDDNFFGNVCAFNGAIKELEKLKLIVKKLVGELSVDEFGEINLDGVKLDNLMLSDGQKKLLKYSVIIHSLTLQNKRFPIFLDEPENQVHPSKLNALIDVFIEFLPDNQLFIASHSITLSSYIYSKSPRSVYYANDGYISSVNLNSEKVIDGLLGGDNGAFLLSDFCSLNTNYAATTFSAECLTPPQSLTYKENDPQVTQIKEFLSWAGNRINILDFGAGSGRLLEGLSCKFDSELESKISYYGLEIDNNSLIKANNIARRIYGNERIYESFDSLKELQIKFNVVFLVNVLHEIHVNDWLNIFKEIENILSEDGYILIVEDTQLPTGELANINGFLILEKKSLETMFDTKNSKDFSHVTSEKYGDRLQATVFPKRVIKNISKQKIINALKEQRSKLISEIKCERKKNEPITYKKSRLHAFKIGLLANIDIALEDFKIE